MKFNGYGVSYTAPCHHTILFVLCFGDVKMTLMMTNIPGQLNSWKLTAEHCYYINMKKLWQSCIQPVTQLMAPTWYMLQHISQLSQFSGESLHLKQQIKTQWGVKISRLQTFPCMLYTKIAIWKPIGFKNHDGKINQSTNLDTVSPDCQQVHCWFQPMKQSLIKSQESRNSLSA